MTFVVVMGIPDSKKKGAAGARVQAAIVPLGTSDLRTLRTFGAKPRQPSPLNQPLKASRTF